VPLGSIHLRVGEAGLAEGAVTRSAAQQMMHQLDRELEGGEIFRVVLIDRRNWESVCSIWPVFPVSCATEGGTCGSLVT
jgi:hypothetical protein